jgi:hypothetical protein
MPAINYRGWTNAHGQLIILNARHIVRVVEQDADLVRVYLVDGKDEHVRSDLKSFESWLTAS